MNANSDNRTITQKAYDEAVKRGVCPLFKGTETLEELMRLLNSTQGIEFMQDHPDYPLDTLRLAKPYKVERFGVYIDAGEIVLNNPPRKLLLIGNTTATITIDKAHRCRLGLIGGAKADVTARDYACVFIRKQSGSLCTYKALDHAIIK